MYSLEIVVILSSFEALSSHVVCLQVADDLSEGDWSWSYAKCVKKQERERKRCEPFSKTRLAMSRVPVTAVLWRYSSFTLSSLVWGSLHGPSVPVSPIPSSSLRITLLVFGSMHHLLHSLATFKHAFCLFIAKPATQNTRVTPKADVAFSPF
jgi:hypothetical protein